MRMRVRRLHDRKTKPVRHRDQGGVRAIRIRIHHQQEARRRWPTRSDRPRGGARGVRRRPLVLVASAYGAPEAKPPPSERDQEEAEGRGGHPPRPAQRPRHGEERQDHAAAEAGQQVPAPAGCRRQRFRRVHLQALGLQPDRRSRCIRRRRALDRRELRRVHRQRGDEPLRRHRQRPAAQRLRSRAAVRRRRQRHDRRQARQRPDRGRRGQ